MASHRKGSQKKVSHKKDSNKRSSQERGFRKKTNKAEISPLLLIYVAGVIICIVYFLVCAYAAVTGEVDYLQKMVWSDRRNVLLVHRWTRRGFAVSFLCPVFADLALMEIKDRMDKKLYGRLTKAMWIFPGLGFLLYIMEMYGKAGISGVMLFPVVWLILFICANLPGAASRWICRNCFKEGKEESRAPGGRNRWLLYQVEWIRFYPLKRLILLSLWLFCVFIGIRGTQKTLVGEFLHEHGAIVMTNVCCILAAVTCYRVMVYVKNSRHCMPCLNRVLSKSEMNQLLDKERFRQAEFPSEWLKKYIPIYMSDNWLVARGTVISRKLAASACIRRSGISEKTDVLLEVYYRNGQKIKVNLNHSLSQELFKELIGVLSEKWDISEEEMNKEEEKKYIGQLKQEFQMSLPEWRTEAEKVRFILQNDAE